MSDVSLKELALKCVEAQLKLNDIIDPKWKKYDYNFPRAVYIEAVEGIDSLNWKWWKQSDNDFDNLKTEMIDILAFRISWLSILGMDMHQIAFLLYNNSSYYKHLMGEVFVIDEIIDTIEDIARIAVNESSDFRHLKINYVKSKQMRGKEDEVIRLTRIVLAMIGVNEYDALKMFMVKNWLNIYRQECGYNTGKYVKEVNGVEDNVIAKQIINENPHLTYKDFKDTMTNNGYGLTS